MIMCDRCPGGLSCLLDYNGAACKHWREENAPDVIYTNADRIRAMTDEELVVFFDEFSSRCLDCVEDAKNESCPIYKEGRYCRPHDIAIWLHQPAEEDT